MESKNNPFWACADSRHRIASLCFCKFAASSIALAYRLQKKKIFVGALASLKLEAGHFWSEKHHIRTLAVMLVITGWSFDLQLHLCNQSGCPHCIARLKENKMNFANCRLFHSNCQATERGFRTSCRFWGEQDLRCTMLQKKCLSNSSNHRGSKENKIVHWTCELNRRAKKDLVPLRFWDWWMAIKCHAHVIFNPTCQWHPQKTTMWKWNFGFILWILTLSPGQDKSVSSKLLPMSAQKRSASILICSSGSQDSCLCEVSSTNHAVKIFVERNKSENTFEMRRQEYSAGYGQKLFRNHAINKIFKVLKFAVCPSSSCHAFLFLFCELYTSVDFHWKCSQDDPNHEMHDCQLCPTQNSQWLQWKLLPHPESWSSEKGPVTTALKSFDGCLATRSVSGDWSAKLIRFIHHQHEAVLPANQTTDSTCQSTSGTHKKHSGLFGFSFSLTTQINCKRTGFGVLTSVKESLQLQQSKILVWIDLSQKKFCWEIAGMRPSICCSTCLSRSSLFAYLFGFCFSNNKSDNNGFESWHRDALYF